ncbi:hypothetical protein JCM6882_007067 [Rhodosporidiobolus microsporus]
MADDGTREASAPVEGHQGGSGMGGQARASSKAPPERKAGDKEPTTTMLARMSGPSDLKAGVGGKRTADEVQRIIYEASKGSKYFNDQERRDKELEVKTARLKRLLAEKEATADGREEEKVDRILEQLEEKRDMSRVIALIDADAFYAACHQRVDPTLKGKAFGVGGGMLTTASYEARKYGCRSAMPLYLAQKLCPHLISLKLQPELYTAASKEIMTILAKYGAIAPASLDEAYVDLTQYCADEGVTPSEAISRLRTEVRETTGLTVSAGVSCNKALSKISADINKPDGQFVVDSTPQACMAFIKDIRLRRCYGIGRVTEVLLNSVGFEKVEDLYTHRRKLYLLRDHLGNKDTFRWLLSLYLGLGSNRVVRAKRGDRKTYGVEKTFSPTNNPEQLGDILRKVAKALAKDLARAEFSGRTITLKIKHDNYEAVTRALTPGKGVWILSYKDIYEYGLRLFRKEQEDRHAALARGEKVKGGKNVMLKPRLLGLRVSNLRDEREVKKENKLDGYFTRPASPSKKKLADISLLSDSDDSDLAHSDHESDIDGDENPEKRALEQLKQQAMESDPFDLAAAEGGMDEMGAAGGGATSGRWMCVDEDVIIEEGRVEPVAGPSRLASAPPPPARRTSSSSSSASSSTLPATTSSSIASTSRSSTKRASPSLAGHEAWKTALTADAFDGGPDGAESQAQAKKQKKDKAPAKQAGGSAFTCPICAKEFQGSEAAMSGHVDKCLRSFGSASSSSGAKKKKAASTLPFPSSTRRLSSKERDKSGGKRKG